MNILIVDDMPEDRRFLRYIAERHGHQVLEAENGQEALKTAATHSFDLIISDALMPVMDGFQFIRQVKSDEALQSIRFIFYSAAYRGKKDVELALSLGADGYIFKPKEPKALWAEVETILKRRKEMALATPKLVKEEEEYLRRYSEIVATKLEQKIKEVDEAKQQLQTLVDNIPDLIARFDRQLRYTHVNPAITKSFGAPAEQLIGKSIPEAAPQLDAERKQRATESIRQVFLSGLPYTYEGPWPMPTGEKIFEIRNVPEKDETGNVTSVLSIARDITQRRQAETLLKNQAEELSEANTALKVLLDRSRQAESEMKEKLLVNIESLTLPYLNQLKSFLTQAEGRALLELIRSNIKDLATSFSGKLSSPVLGLTPREIQVADLIRGGRANKEIAAMLCLSVGTVEFYRDKIRKKLGIKSRKTNLRSYLSSQFKD